MEPLLLATPANRQEKPTRALQKALNGKFAHFHIDRRITVDGELGRETIGACRQIGRAMGARKNALVKLNRGRVSIGLQKLIRELRPKSKIERLNTRRRKPYRAKLRNRYAASAGQVAVNKAMAYRGTTEQPPGSNWGGKVEQFIRFTGYTFPVYWCGCWAAWVVIKLGGAKIPQRIRLGYAPYITADARAGRNGLTAVSAGNARAGDIGTLWNGQHIVVLTGPAKNGKVPTIEGNTSPGDGGSQSNGGGVYERVRNVADFDCFARPDYS